MFGCVINKFSDLLKFKIGELQVEINELQSQQVSLQLEQKELKKKQRRSERYYSNKSAKEGSLGLHRMGDDGSEPSIDENTPEDGELSATVTENPDEDGLYFQFFLIFFIFILSIWKVK